MVTLEDAGTKGGKGGVAFGSPAGMGGEAVDDDNEKYVDNRET